MRERLREIACGTGTLLAAVWLGLFPLLCDFTYSHITRSKWEIALALGGATLLLGALAALMRGKRLSVSVPWWLCIAYFGWTALSARFGAWASHTNAQGQLTVWIGSGRYEGLSTQLCYLAIFLGMSLAGAQLRRPLAACAAGLAVFTLIVALQYAGFNPLGLFPNGRSVRTNYEFQGTIGNIDMVSGYLTLVTPLLLGWWLLGGGKRVFRAAMLAAGLLGVLLLLFIEVQSGIICLGLMLALCAAAMLTTPGCRSRGLVLFGGVLCCVSLRLVTELPWLDGSEEIAFLEHLSPIRLMPGVLGVLLFGAAWLVDRHPGRAVKLRTVILLGAALALCAVIAVALLPIPESAGGLYELHELLCGRAQDAYGSWRIGVWRHTLEMSAEHPLFGTGADTFYPAMRAHLTAEGAVLGENFDNPHNIFLAILSNCGVPALALFAAMLLGVLLCCARQGTEGKLLAAAILCYAVQGCFTFSICIVTPMFWALLGLGAAGDGRIREPEERGS